jgi:hypothetical protein
MAETQGRGEDRVELHYAVELTEPPTSSGRRRSMDELGLPPCSPTASSCSLARIDSGRRRG